MTTKKYSWNMKRSKKICSYPISIDETGASLKQCDASEMLSTDSISLVVGGAVKQCICDRDSNAFFCTACDRFFYGRLSQPCKQHPNVIFLLDQPRCVHCQAGQYMIRPVMLDRQTVLDINAADKSNKIKFVDPTASTAT